MTFDLRPTPIVKKLMIGLLGTWLAFNLLIDLFEQSWASDLYRALGLAPHEVLGEGRIWQVISYAALHDLNSPGHVVFNLLGLLFLAPPLERRWGQRGFLQFVAFSALIAGVFSLLCGLIAPSYFSARVFGFSGVVMAIVAAFSIVMPNATLLLFFVVPVKARWIVWLALGIDTMVFLSAPGESDIAFHTHLGGVLAAWLLITGNWRPSLLKDRLHLFTLKRKRRRPKLRIVKGGKDDEMLN